MTIYTRVKFGLDSCIIQTHWLFGFVEVFDASLSVLFVLNFKLLRELQINFNHFFLVDRLLFDIEIVHDEEVLGTTGFEIDSVDLLVRRLTVMNDISIMVFVVKYVLAWIHEHFQLTCDPHFERDQKDVLLLVQDHTNVFELQPLEHTSLKNDLVKLVACACLVIVSPHLFLLKDLYHLDLFLHELLIVIALSKDVGVLSKFNLDWFAHLLEVNATLVLHQLYTRIVGHLVVQQLGQRIVRAIVIICTLIVFILLNGI